MERLERLSEQGLRQALIGTGVFINDSASRQYFIGTKRAITSIGSSPFTTTDMKVGDLPPASQDYTKGITVAVFDALAPVVGSTVAGGGSTMAYVFNNGSAWKVIGV
jgi:hypothetical protein